MAGRPTKEQALAIAARRARAVQLRGAGLSFDAIARAIPDITDAHMASADVREGLRRERELGETPAELALSLEAIRLEAMERSVHGVLQDATQGKDHKLVLECTDRLLKIAERRERVQAAEARQKPAEASPLDEIRARRQKKFRAPA